MSTSIPISALNVEQIVSSQDFIPIVNSASLTTYKTSIQSFGTWIQQSGSASSSFSSISSSFSGKAMATVSASWASQSFNSVSASYAPATISASWANNALSASYAITASSAINLVTAATYPVTASWALNTVTTKTSVVFFSQPVKIDSGVNAQSITKYTGSIIPSYASGVILQAYTSNANTNTVGFIYISSDNGVGNDKRILCTYWSAGSGDAVSSGGQGFFPVSSSTTQGTFWYQVTQPSDNGWEIDIVGYF